MGNIPPKKVLNADAGDADHVGGNDWDDVVDFLNDTDKTGPVKINTETWFRDGKLKFRDSNNDHNYTHNFSNLSANRAITWPLLTGDDTVAFQAHAATLTNKTIDPITNTIKSRTNTLMTKSGSTYYAIKNDGSIISSSTTAETVIAAAIADSTTSRATLYFETDIDWTLSAGFTGFTITDNCRIKTDNMTGTYIIVPQGFSGAVFTIGGAGSNAAETVSIDGINILEGGTPSKLWTGIKLAAPTDGSCWFATFQNIEIANAAVAFELETTGTGFINNCVFKDISIFMGGSSLIGFLFDESGGEISENMFQNINIETNSGAGWGFKNVDGTGNIFINCKNWDGTAASTEMNITSGASGTTIIGGRMGGGGGHFIDEGVKTLIIDSGNVVNTRLVSTPDLCKVGTWYGVTPTNAEGLLNGKIATVFVGTGSSAQAIDSTGNYRTFDTGATINSLSGIRLDIQQFRRILNPYFKTAIYLNSVSDVRFFAGFVASGSAPSSSSDPLNALEGCALWFDSAVSANWKRYHNDSSGAGTVDDTSVTALTATLYPIEIFAVSDSKFRFVFNGTSTDITTNIPASTTNLAWWIYMENTTGASRTYRNYYVINRVDK